MLAKRHIITKICERLFLVRPDHWRVFAMSHYNYRRMFENLIDSRRVVDQHVDVGLRLHHPVEPREELGDTAVREDLERLKQSGG